MALRSHALKEIIIRDRDRPWKAAEKSDLSHTREIQ